MKILFITKRFYMRRDLVEDSYGRYFELPRALVNNGADVHVVCLSYYRAREFDHEVHAGITWSSFNSGTVILPGIYRHFFRLEKILEDSRPDAVIAGSDAVHCILAEKLCGQNRLPWLLDLYDNYEAYQLTRIPGVRSRFGRAVSCASGVSVVSHELSKMVTARYRPAGPVRVITNAVPDGMFFPRDKIACRNMLGLPVNGRLAGTAGSLSGSRGIQQLYRAFLELLPLHPDLYLVLAGAGEKPDRPPVHERVIHLGDLPYDRMPLFYNSLDAGVICLNDDEFGRYCFPQKLYEMLACRLPVVAADIGELRHVLEGSRHCTYLAGDTGSLAGCLARQLTDPELPALGICNWQQQGDRLMDLLKTVT